MSEWYDREGKPMPDVMTWGAKMQDPDYQRLAADDVGEYWVSTVWLGIDHGFGRGAPLIFETMIFSGEGSERSGGYTERYSTETEALAGHARIVAQLREGWNPSEDR